MAFVNTQMPSKILLSATGGPTWDAEIVEYGQGARYVNRKINQSRYRFNLRQVVEDSLLFAQLTQFFEALGGPASGFLIDNWLDNSTSMGGAEAADDMPLTDGDGSTTTFNLVRTYTQGGLSTTRRIYKPKQNIAVEVNGSPVTVVYDTTPSVGEVSVNTGTGVLTFEAAPGSGLSVTWGGGYYYPVALEGGSIDFAKLGGVYETNLSLIELLSPDA